MEEQTQEMQPQESTTEPQVPHQTHPRTANKPAPEEEPVNTQENDTPEGDTPPEGEQTEQEGDNNSQE